MTDISTQLSRATAASTTTDRGANSDTSLPARGGSGQDVSPFARELSRVNEHNRSDKVRDTTPGQPEVKPAKPRARETSDTRNEAAQGLSPTKTVRTGQHNADELLSKATPTHIQLSVPEAVSGGVLVNATAKPMEPSQVPGAIIQSPTQSHLTHGKNDKSVGVVPNTVSANEHKNARATDVELTANQTSPGRGVSIDAVVAGTDASANSGNSALVSASVTAPLGLKSVSTGPDEGTSVRAEAVSGPNAKPSVTPADPVHIQPVNGRAVLSKAVNTRTDASTSVPVAGIQGIANTNADKIESTTDGSGDEIVAAVRAKTAVLPVKPTGKPTGKPIAPDVTLDPVAGNSVIQPATRGVDDLPATAGNSIVPEQRIALSVLRVGDTVTTSTIANHFKQLSVNGNSKTATVVNDTSGSDESASLAGRPSARTVTTLTGTDAKNKVVPENAITRSRDLSASYQVSSNATGGISVSKLKTDQLTAMASRTTSQISPGSAAPALSVEQTVGLHHNELTSAVADATKKKAEVGKGIALPNLTSLAASASSPDNMLPDSPGGIVTAPVLARTDSATTQMVSTPLSVPLMLPVASDAMASNISWMVKEGVQNASVNVMPAGMGPISVKIGIENEQMNVSIVATQGTTREALEALLPRLREQLLTQGVDSVKVEISDGKSEQSRGSNTQNPNQAFERQSFANEQGTGRDTSQAGNRNTEDGESRNSKADAGSGERELTDAEQVRVAGLQGILPQTMPGSDQIRQGYDLYV